jgi:hypothetical protein
MQKKKKGTELFDGMRIKLLFLMAEERLITSLHERFRHLKSFGNKRNLQNELREG